MPKFTSRILHDSLSSFDSPKSPSQANFSSIFQFTGLKLTREKSADVQHTKTPHWAVCARRARCGRRKKLRFKFFNFRAFSIPILMYTISLFIYIVYRCFYFCCMIFPFLLLLQVFVQKYEKIKQQKLDTLRWGLSPVEWQRKRYVSITSYGEEPETDSNSSLNMNFLCVARPTV